MFGARVIKSFAERECITISSDSEMEELSVAPPKSRDNDAVVTTLEMRKRGMIIDAIVDRCAHSLKRKKKRKKKRKSCVQKKTFVEQMNRDERKCAKLGLRPSIKLVDPYSASPSPKMRRSSDEEADNDNDAIRYLLHNVLQKDGVKEEHSRTLSEQASSDSDSRSTCSDDVTSQEHRQMLEYKKQKSKSLDLVRNFQLALDDVCLSCGTTDDVAHLHPLFEGGLCQQHHAMAQEWSYILDSDGNKEYCSVCCMGREVVICDQPGCGNCFCSDCLDLLAMEGAYKRIASTEDWKCFVCVKDPDPSSLIRRRRDWRRRIQAFYGGSDSEYPPFPIPQVIPRDQRRPIRILSLFDGIATGMVAIKQLGFQVGKFVASEIDENAIRLVQNRHPEVIHVGDITQFSDDDIARHGPFDLVMGGSPCNDLSGANPRRKGLLDAEGTGCLFFDFFRVLQAARPCSCASRRGDDVTERPFFWLFENVLSMKKIERKRISRFLNCSPVVADARLVSAAARPRLFWGNLPNMRQLRLTMNSDHAMSVQSCLEPGRTATVEKLTTITTKPTCLYQGVLRKAPVTHNGKDDVLWTTELERIFGVPEHYTDVNNLGPKERLALLGRSWSVPVVKQILAPLKQYFATGPL